MGKISTSNRIRNEAAVPAATHFQGIQRGSYGFSMLEKMGWAEGKGLGAKEDGITTHIRVKKREDGIGASSLRLVGGSQCR
jgi:hypothetical protein